jgi:hypothetical protein
MSTEQTLKELNGTAKQQNQMQQIINMDSTPDGNVIVTWSFGFMSYSGVIPGVLMDDFIAKRLKEKRMIEQVLKDPRGRKLA